MTSLDFPESFVHLCIKSSETTIASVLSNVSTEWSMPLGSKNFTETYLESDPPLPEELSAGLSVVELYLDEARRSIPALASLSEAVPIFGSGDVFSLGALEQGVSINADGLTGLSVEAKDFEDLFRSIVVESVADRAYNPGLAEGFVVDSVGACSILVECLRQLGIQQVVLCSEDLSSSKVD